MPFGDGNEHSPELPFGGEGRGRCEICRGEVREQCARVRDEVREGRGEARLSQDGDEGIWCQDVQYQA